MVDSGIVYIDTEHYRTTFYTKLTYDVESAENHVIWIKDGLVNFSYQRGRYHLSRDSDLFTFGCANLTDPKTSH